MATEATSSLVGYLWTKRRRFAALLARFTGVYSGPFLPLLLVVGLGLLVGRFYWQGTHAASAWRSYLVSSYFFLTFIPFVYFLLKELFPNSRLPTLIALPLGILFTLPHHLLKAGDWFPYQLAMIIPPDSGPNSAHLNWVTRANLFSENFPGDRALFLGLFVLGCLIVGLFPSQATRKKTIGVKLAVILCGGILLSQAWLHLSMRSPYTYLPHFEQPSSDPHFYLMYVFKNGTGAVNQDYYWHQYSEQLFLGSSGKLPIMVGRTFAAYLLSHFIRFLHPYYVWLVFNLSLWAAAVGCFYYLGRELYGKRAGLFAALLLLSAPGMINYVGQPMFYILVNANLVFIAALYYRFFIKEEITRNRALLFGVLLGLSSLNYELSPWFLTLIFIGLTRPKPRFLLLSLATGFLIYQGYYQMARHLPLLDRHNPFLGGSQSPLLLAKQIFLEGQYHLVVERLSQLATLFPSLMYHAFSLTLIPALLGIYFLRPHREFKSHFPLFLLLPGFIICTAMVALGSGYYLEYPRMVYGNFVGIYLLSAVFLSALCLKLRPKFFPNLGSLIAWAYIIGNLYWMNFDVFGHPNIYFHWFYRIARYAHIHPLS